MRKQEKSFDRAEFQRTLREQKLQALQKATAGQSANPKPVDVEAGRALAPVSEKATIADEVDEA